MAKQIITLGIGATDNLIPFITTGLDIGTPVEFINVDHSVFVPFRDKRVINEFRDKRANVLFRDKRTQSGGR
jgi:hypothetical protein